MLFLKILIENTEITDLHFVVPIVYFLCNLKPLENEKFRQAQMNNY